MDPNDPEPFGMDVADDDAGEEDAGEEVPANSTSNISGLCVSGRFWPVPLTFNFNTFEISPSCIFSIGNRLFRHFYEGGSELPAAKRIEFRSGASVRRFDDHSLGFSYFPAFWIAFRHKKLLFEICWVSLQLRPSPAGICVDKNL